jgi:hypothetical protein
LVVDALQAGVLEDADEGVLVGVVAVAFPHSVVFRKT